MGNLHAMSRYEGYGVTPDDAITSLRWNVRGINRLANLPAIKEYRCNGENRICCCLDGKCHVIYLQVVDNRWYIAMIDLGMYGIEKLEEVKDSD